MTIKDLKLIIADMPDDGRVFARDRDCISLDQVHVVGHPNKANAMADVKYVDSMADVYGGDEERFSSIQSAIIFCDCD